MENDYLVSIIIPIYNTGKYLPNCLDSIVRQTYKNLEIICINDGSTDNSAKILEKYAKKDSRIKIITQKNRGLSGARNAGLKIATGEYITFVDPDDKIKTNMIKKLLELTTQSNAKIAISSFREISLEGRSKYFNHKYPQKIYNTEQALKAMLLEKGFNTTATMKLFHKSTLDNIQFPVGKIHEDIATTYKIIMNAKRIVFTPEAHYVYYRRKNSITYSFYDQRLDLIIFTDKMCNEIDQKYPNLINVTKICRMRARLSILKQIPIQHPETKNLIKYLKTHESYITKNPESTKTDKIILSNML